MGKYRVIDLFAGVGGLSYGFAHNPSFDIVMANEYEKDIAKAYSLNHPTVDVIEGDIKNITEEMLQKYLNDNIDIVIGGPPCQSYSTLGKRQMDARAHLFEEYCRILSIVKPTMFLFENVVGLLSMQGGELIKKIKKSFINLGYQVKIEILNAVDFGVPQYRERVIIVGMKKNNYFEYPNSTHGDGKKSYMTVKDALSDLPVMKSGEKSDEYASAPQNELQKFYRKNTTILTDNEAPRNGERILKIMEMLPDGGSKSDLPESLRPNSGYANTYAKMWWEKPAPTITRNFATPSSSRCIHPRDSRAMTTREGARLQTFPDDYKFYGSASMKNLEIGNAVPPLLSIALAKQVLIALDKHESNDTRKNVNCAVIA